MLCLLICGWSVSVEYWVVIGWWWVTCSWTRARCCRIVCRRSHWRRWWTCQCRWDTGLESGERTRTWTVWTRTGSQDSQLLVWEQTSLAERICLPHSDNTAWSGGHRWRSDTRIYDEKYFTFDLSTSSSSSSYLLSLRQKSSHSVLLTSFWVSLTNPRSS